MHNGYAKVMPSVATNIKEKRFQRHTPQNSATPGAPNCPKSDMCGWFSLTNHTFLLQDTALFGIGHPGRIPRGLLSLCFFDAHTCAIYNDHIVPKKFDAL